MGNVRRKITSRRSRHGPKDSKVFFMVLIATYESQWGSAYTADLAVPYHSASPSDVSAGCPYPCDSNTTEASVTNFLDYLEAVFKGGHGGM